MDTAALHGACSHSCACMQLWLYDNPQLRGPLPHWGAGRRPLKSASSCFPDNLARAQACNQGTSRHASNAGVWL